MATTTVAEVEAPKPDSSKWCWECRRRRLVCDCAYPVCNKCNSTGVVCPGYEDKKPLTWLAPGRVLSRNRKTRSKPTDQNAVVRSEKEKGKKRGPIAKAPRGIKQQTLLFFPGVQPRPDLCDMAEAAMYYNRAVYPDLVANQLAPNPFVVPVLELQKLPSPIQHALVAMALSHRIYRSAAPLALPLEACSDPMRKAWWSRLHRHRGLAISLMNEDIGKEETRASDETITTVLVFLIGELQQSISNQWRPHVNGIMALLKLRGGFDKLMQSAERLKPSLLALLLVIVTANTTSPADDQISLASSLELTNVVPSLYGLGIYPPFPCAQYLFHDMLRVNHLRARKADPFNSLEDIEHLSAEAQTILDHITAFSPQQWADSNASDFSSAWLLVGEIFHSALTLYCISSLQSISLLPSSPELQTRRSEQRDRLMLLLAEGLEAQLLKKSLLWPLIVAGFEARDGSDIERKFVLRYLDDQSRELGSSQPLVAKAAFERFWSGGRTRWDECFDRPYAFLV
ncbi:fungal-specific transcription factor domain-containing protein [Coniochaeta sp. 2T2.1]|nr:fungal-specific transcription factor domain-containing protein [Coniochaeta sp. 2T2.1]